MTFAEDAASKQAVYAEQRRRHRELWEQSEAEDFCARKEVEPGTYKALRYDSIISE